MLNGFISILWTHIAPPLLMTQVPKISDGKVAATRHFFLSHESQLRSLSALTSDPPVLTRNYNGLHPPMIQMFASYSP